MNARPTHAKDRRWRDFYDRWAPVYDLGIGFGALIGGYSDARERRKMVRLLALKPGSRVLEVSVGTGSNLAAMAKMAGPDGLLVGLDISRGMLAHCGKKVRRLRLRAELLVGEASQLPFADGRFDAVLHFGGINLFDDMAGAIEEMMRVAKPGARIVIGDEGIRPDKRKTLRSRFLIRTSRLYENDPPLHLLPKAVADARVRWFRGDACYLIDFTNP